MKKNIFSLLIILVIIVSLGISCKTTGDAPDDSSKLNVAKKAVDESRKRAMDFDGPAYFPSEWEELEARYKTAGTVEECNALAAGYDEIFKKSIALYAQAKEDEIMASRERLINTGFLDYVPDYLENADNTALSAKSQYEAGEYYKAKETADAALKEYETLNMGADVFLARQEVIDRGFVQYDPDNFSKADEVAQSALKAYDAGNKEEAVTKAEEALLRYNLVLSNGWTAYASDRRASALKERELAIAERANIASRETFRTADIFCEQAEEMYKLEHFNDASIAYVEAEAMFAISRKETEEKRLRAQESIQSAREKIAESSEAATEAGRIIEGGSK